MLLEKAVQQNLIYEVIDNDLILKFTDVFEINILNVNACVTTFNTEFL